MTDPQHGEPQFQRQTAQTVARGPPQRECAPRQAQHARAEGQATAQEQRKVEALVHAQNRRHARVLVFSRHGRAVRGGNGNPA